MLRTLPTVVLLLACLAAAQNEGTASCTHARSPVEYFSVPGRPFAVAASRDSCWLFVSLSGSGRESAGGIAVVSRVGGHVRLERLLPLESMPMGLALSHDARMLIVADERYVVFLDAEALLSGGRNPLLGRWSDGPNAGSVYVGLTRDDKFLFVSDERAQAITVVDMVKARGSHFNAEASIVGTIHTGIAPIALTFSPDDRWLYTTSEAASKEWNWPVACKPEGEEIKGASSHPQGAVVVVDVARAEREPASAIVARVPAGCSPVRLALSRSGETAWVTARNSNAVLSFDTAKLRQNDSHAQLASVPVGAAPVGIALFNEDSRLLVTNSNRFGSDPKAAQSLSVIDITKFNSGAAAVLGTVEAGAFPREITVSSDGRIAFVTNFNSGSIEILDLQHLPVRAQSPPMP